METLVIAKGRLSQTDLEETGCSNCQKLKQKVGSKQSEIINLTRKVEEITSEKTHFFNSFQDKLNQYNNLDEETGSELQKLRSDLQDKSKTIDALMAENEEKEEDNQRLREEVKQLRFDVGDLKGRIEMGSEEVGKSGLEE